MGALLSSDDRPPLKGKGEKGWRRPIASIDSSLSSCASWPDSLYGELPDIRVCSLSPEDYLPDPQVNGLDGTDHPSSFSRGRWRFLHTLAATMATPSMANVQPTFRKALPVACFFSDTTDLPFITRLVSQRTNTDIVYTIKMNLCQRITSLNSLRISSGKGCPWTVRPG